MNPIQMPDKMPPQLEGLSRMALRSAFMATVLEQLPVSYRNMLSVPDANSSSQNEYQKWWNESVAILSKFKNDMDENTGRDWTPSRMRGPETVKPHEIVQQAMAKKTPLLGRAKQPIIAANLPRRGPVPGDMFQSGGKPAA
jgi:hypothetical protein